MIPFLTSETAFRQRVCELVFSINAFDLDFGIQVDSVKQTRATLWVRDTCLIVGLVP